MKEIVVYTVCSTLIEKHKLSDFVDVTDSKELEEFVAENSYEYGTSGQINREELELALLTCVESDSATDGTLVLTEPDFFDLLRTVREYEG